MLCHIAYTEINVNVDRFPLSNDFVSYFHSIGIKLKQWKIVSYCHSRYFQTVVYVKFKRVLILFIGK